jgi:hypothetical protein
MSLGIRNLPARWPGRFLGEQVEDYYCNLKGTVTVVITAIGSPFRWVG